MASVASSKKYRISALSLGFGEKSEVRLNERTRLMVPGA